MNLRILQGVFFLLMLVGILVITFFIFQTYLAPIIFAAALSVAVSPIYRWVIRTLKFSETLAALTIVVTVFVIIILPLVLLGIRAVGEADVLYGGLTAGGNLTSELLIQKLSNILPDAARITLDTQEYIGRALNWIIAHIGSFFSSVAKIIGYFFISLVTFYFFLKEGSRLKSKLMEWSPLSSHHEEEIADRLAQAVNSVMRGTLIVALVQGILAGVGFWFFNIPEPALWALATVIAALIPLVGTAIITIPATGILALMGNVTGAVGIFVWGFGVVGLIDNFLRPKLLERGMQLHPLVIFLSVLGGLQFFGPIGFLLGPLTVSLLVALLELFPHVVFEKPL